MQKVITLDDVIASHEKYGCVLGFNAKKSRDLKTLNPKSKFDTTYIPIEFNHINGSKMPVKIKFSNQLTASGAKIPQGSDEEGTPKYLNLSFSHMEKEDIEGGDYVAKTCDTKEKQDIENKRVSDNIAEYMANNAKFLKVMDIIESSYNTVCQQIISEESSFQFQLRKDKKQKDITTHSFKQTTFANRETNKDEKLKNPIYRLKIPVCKKDGRIGIWSNYNNEFKPTVFDARKMTKKNNYQAVPAQVVVNGKLCDLDVNNAASFITYKSLVGGHIVFECIVVSKFGLSINSSFYDLFVIRHKAKAASSTISRDEIIQMRGGAASDDDDSDAELVKETPVVNNSSDSDEAVEVIRPEEPVDSDDEPDSKTEIKVEEPEPKKAPTRGRKPASKK